VIVVVSATVVTENPEHVVKAAEILGRAAAGLGLDGISVSLTIGIPDEEEEADSDG